MIQGSKCAILKTDLETIPSFSIQVFQFKFCKARQDSSGTDHAGSGPMNWLAGLRVAGLMMAVLSLFSYYVVESKPENISIARPNLQLENGQIPSFNIVIAGRDIEYCKPGYGPGGLKAVPCEGPERYSGRTDTIMFMRVSPGRLDVISIPRDTRVEDRFGEHKINSSFQLGGAEALELMGLKSIKEPGASEVFARGGADALKSALEGVLGVGIDYSVMFNVEFVERVIDALGGVTVNLPEPMDYDDNAADLHIHLPAGNQHLDAKTAIGYLRFRHGYGSDYARMDRGKAVVGQLLEKLKGPAALAIVPTVLAGLQSDVQTNMDAGFVQTLVPFVRTLKPHFKTLPTLEQRFNSYLLPDTEGIAKLLGPGIGLGIQPTDPLIDPGQPDPGQPDPGQPDPGQLDPGQPDILNPDASLGTAPQEVPTILDASGTPGFGQALVAYFKRLGLPEAKVVTLEASDEPSQVLRRPWSDEASVDYYSQFLDLPIFEPYRYPSVAGPLAITLGRDATQKYAALVLEASRVSGLKP
jgi:polyisoprenyl-teichoic acid--peptidoglycan teichoic acid transferase